MTHAKLTPSCRLETETETQPSGPHIKPQSQRWLHKQQHLHFFMSFSRHHVETKHHRFFHRFQGQAASDRPFATCRPAYSSGGLNWIFRWKQWVWTSREGQSVPESGSHLKLSRKTVWNSCQNLNLTVHSGALQFGVNPQLGGPLSLSFCKDQTSTCS